MVAHGCARFFLFFLLFASSLAYAEAPAEAILFAGERYERAFVSQKGDFRLAEYVRPGETVEKWTRLIAVRQFANLNNVENAAAGVIRELQRKEPEARFQFLVKEGGGEAMVDFLARPESGSWVEFNAFRYRKVPGIKGLVAYQFAYRFELSDIDATHTFKKARNAWLEELRSVEWPLHFNP